MSNVFFQQGFCALVHPFSLLICVRIWYRDLGANGGIEEH